MGTLAVKVNRIQFDALHEAQLKNITKLHRDSDDSEVRAALDSVLTVCRYPNNKIGISDQHFMYSASTTKGLQEAIEALELLRYADDSVLFCKHLNYNQAMRVSSYSKREGLLDADSSVYTLTLAPVVPGNLNASGLVHLHLVSVGTVVDIKVVEKRTMVVNDKGSTPNRDLRHPFAEVVRLTIYMYPECFRATSSMDDYNIGDNVCITPGGCGEPVFSEEGPRKQSFLGGTYTPRALGYEKNIYKAVVASKQDNSIRVGIYEESPAKIVAYSTLKCAALLTPQEDIVLYLI